MKQSTSKMETAVTLGAGLVAIAAASYFFLGPRGKKNQQRTRGWMIKMKGDVIEKLESAKDITQSSYDSIVDTVGEAYTAVSDSKEEVAQLADELKRHWKSIATKVVQENKAKKAKRSRP